MLKGGPMCPPFFILLLLQIFFMILECLEKLVGISNTDCDCIIGDLEDAEQDALKESTSGLFVDDLPGSIELKSMKTLDSCRNLAVIMISSRDRALQTMQDDLIIAISNRYAKAVKNYQGTIGRSAYAITLSNARQFQGIRLIPRNHTDATVRVSRFRLIGNAAVTLNVYIVRTEEGSNGQGGSVVFTAAVNTLANNFATVTLPDVGIVLPLIEDGIIYEYWIYFDKALTAFLPKDTKIGCNCPKGSNDTLDEYFQMQGTSFTDPSNMVSTGALDAYTHGVLLDVEIKCETAPLICRELAQSEEIAVSLAQAAIFKTGEITIEEVMKSSEVNRFTLQAKEYNWGKRNHFRAEYATRISFIAGAIDPNNSDCFTCKERELFFTKISG